MTSAPQNQYTPEAISEALNPERAEFYDLLDDPSHRVLALRFQGRRRRSQVFNWILKRSSAHWHRAHNIMRQQDHWLFGPHFRPTDVLRHFIDQHGRCYWCDEELADFHVDHVRPLAQSLDNSAGNIVLSCRPCNVGRERRHANAGLATSEPIVFTLPVELADQLESLPKAERDQLMSAALTQAR